MEIRRTGEAREIQKFETEIRRQTGRAISAGYHAGKGFRKTAKFSEAVVKLGIAQGKNQLRSRDVRVQLKNMTPEQRKQWNSYSFRKQDTLIWAAEASVQNKVLRKQVNLGFHTSPLEKEINRLAETDRYSVTLPAGKTARQMKKNKKRGKVVTETFYEGNPLKAQKKIRRLESAVDRQVKKEARLSKWQFHRVFHDMLSKQTRKSGMVKEQQLNDEIFLAEAQTADVGAAFSYLTILPRAKLYQKMGELLRGLAGWAAQKFLALATMLLPVLLPFILIVVLLCGILMPAVSSGEYRGIAHVTPQVEFYRPYLEKYAALYPGMEKLVDLMLAMIMQEAGGEPWIGTMDGDIMQSSESAGYPGPGYLVGEASIAQGVKYLATEVFNKAGLLEDPYNMEKTKLALQGYNFGSGYIDWALRNYGGYSEENAAIFSDMMAARLGWRAYGDKQYVPHVLRYYEIKWDGAAGSVSTEEVTNQETRSRLEEVSASWPGDLEEGRKNIIVKGCTLAGYTTYDMYGADTRSGVDFPRTLDCSSFTAWCFQKCGYTDVPYWSTTGTFLSSSNFYQINRTELKPGDIGLINWVGEGGSNHVGIYVGCDSTGTPMWLHCTSHTCAGSGIVTGPRISYYSSFSLFFRYRGFDA